MANPSVRSSSANSAASATSVTISKPAGTSSGDLLVAFVDQASGSKSFNAPSGWTAYGSTFGGAGVVHLQGFYKIAGGSEPASYTFQQGGAAVNVDMSGVIVAVQNPNGAPQADTTNGGTSASGPSAPSITTQTGNWLLLWAVGADNGGSSQTGPPSFSSINAAGTGSSLTSVFSATQAAAGPTGTEPGTLTPAANWACEMVAMGPYAPPAQMRTPQVFAPQPPGPFFD
jgi:hypothetical protein